MTRSRLKNIYLKIKAQQDRKNYNKQKNYCVKLLRKAKRTFYSNLDAKSVTDNKTWWKTLKPLFSDKQPQSGEIVLVQGNEITDDDIEVASISVDFFDM